MKTKNIFKALALAMLMPAMMLTTACSNDDDVVNNAANTENTINKGYALPVTVNVTRQGDATTRATYTDNGNGTGSLAFSAGDKLFVNGYGTVGVYAGTLTWQSDGTFSGTITTEKAYSGTADALFSNNDVRAVLLPNGYETYGFFSIDGEGYDSNIVPDYTKAFADSKAAAVAQFSYESTETYSNGFALAPHNAILNFTITGLTVSTDVNVVFTDGDEINFNKTVTTDESGAATFAIGVGHYSYLDNFSLTVGGKAITLGSKTLEAGHIYNITRSAAPAPAYTMAANATAEDVGKLICTDGHIHADGADDDCTKVRVAKIAYVGNDAETSQTNTAFKNGLALALEDVSGTKAWCSQQGALCLGTQYNNSTTKFNDLAGIDNTNDLVNHTGHTHAAASAARGYNSSTHPAGTSAWFLPSAGQWDKMATAAGSYENLKTNAGLQKDNYWSSTEANEYAAWRFNFDSGIWNSGLKKSSAHPVRACLAF